MKRILFAIFLWFSFIAFVQSAPQTYSSDGSSVSVLELYTSEGCSSCPPAERWFNSLKNDSRLWKEFIPVAFHVDYWNYIGWEDRFSSSIYSQRQKIHVAQNHISAVYTPGLILSGEEWRGWRLNRPMKFDVSKQVGKLTVDVNSSEVDAVFKVVKNDKKAFINIAVLGFDLETKVKAGENKNKILKHDFVVLGYKRQAMQKTEDGYLLSTDLPMQSEVADKQGLAVWVEYADDITPVQATGGWLE